MASSAGGMDIEEVAASTPEKDSERDDRSGSRVSIFSGAKAGVWPRLAGSARGPGSEVHAVALFGLRADGCITRWRSIRFS